MLKLKPKYAVLIGLAGLNLAGLSLPFFATADTQTSDTAISLSVASVITSYSSGPTVTLGAITPDSTGRQSIASDSISASTNDSAGMTITLEEKSAVTTSMLSGANTIAASSGTTASPITLTNGTWGFRVDSLAGFGAGPSTTQSNVTPSALTFAGIPANGSPYTIKTTATNGATSQTVWYSARVNNTQPTGSYTTTVTYTYTTN
jgi:hypothetical protein